MERLKANKVSNPEQFLMVGLILLLLGMLFGIIGSLQYVLPGFLKSHLSFEKIRPLHVSSVVFWILMAAMGSVLSYTKTFTGKELFSTRLLRIQLWIFIGTILLILGSYLDGTFGGREYWEFPPLLSLPIIMGWAIFAINYLKSIQSLRNQPVYVWMWMTGVVGFLFIFVESNLWLLPYFQQDIIRDMTVQWKSYGSLVGCWNMLIYGSAIFLMEKISGDQTYGQSKMAFALYFLGLFNLFFNWSHHIYTLPINVNIKHIGYLVSMTELLILGRMIYKWKGSLTEAQRFKHLIPFQFLWAADIWILLNLILAILMSVPAINIYTHGTHVTVAHVMGTTIGINTMLLMAMCFDILARDHHNILRFKRQITSGHLVVNGSLFVFLVALVGAGIQRSRWQMGNELISFSEMMGNLVPYFVTFAIAGLFLFAGFSLLIYPLLRLFMMKGSTYLSNGTVNTNKLRLDGHKLKKKPLNKPVAADGDTIKQLKLD